MDRKEEVNEVLDIPVAERKYLVENNPNLYRKFLIAVPVFLLLFSITVLRLSRNSKLGPFRNNIQNTNNQDHSILGHLPYSEVSKEKLVLVEPNIKVHIDMRKSLLKMKEDAKNDGSFLVFLSFEFVSSKYFLSATGISNLSFISFFRSNIKS